MNERILLVEDEDALQMALGDRLRREGYSLDIASDGITGYQKAIANTYDLMILDIMLPERSGLDLCRDIRLSGIGSPIVLLTARDTTEDKVIGLKLGADDYITKPFNMHELVARIEALLRRNPAYGGTNIHVFGSVRIDLSSLQVTKDGNPVHLSALEFRLIRYFLRNPGIGLSRQKILKEVWGQDEFTTTRTVDVHVAGLREKLENDPSRPELIVTVKGFGYLFRGSQAMGFASNHK
jgi:two-component system alkaline phosphatase synthesis response regulator PhoP